MSANHVIELKGGGSLVNKQIAGVDVKFHRSKEGKVEMISDEKYKALLGAKHLSSGAKRHASSSKGAPMKKRHAPRREEPDAEGAHGAKKVSHTSVERYRVVPSSGESLKKGALRSIQNDKRAVKNMKRDLASRDISEYVYPYAVHPGQEKLLKNILGTENVAELKQFNALVHNGILNNSCPPQGRPDLTEEYTDPVTGVKQCRPPMRAAMLQGSVINKGKCPDPNGGDPYAIESYLTHDNQVTCRRPVLRGEFQCPPYGRPADKFHHTLSDGTGVCINRDPRNQDLRDLEIATSVSEILMASMTPDVKALYKTIFGTLTDMHLTKESAERLNKIFVSTKCTKDLVAELENDTFFKARAHLFKRILTSKDNVCVANRALYDYIEQHLPEYFDDHQPSSVHFLKFFSVHPMTGGRRKVRRVARRVPGGATTGGRKRRVARRVARRVPGGATTGGKKRRVAKRPAKKVKVNKKK